MQSSPILHRLWPPLISVCFLFYGSTGLAQSDDASKSQSVAQLDAQTALDESQVSHPGIADDTELGFVQSQGNSNVQSANVKQLNSYLWSGNSLKADFQLLRSESAGVESAKRWSAGTEFERDLTKTFAFYVFQGFESDIYAGYDLRAQSEVGVHQMLYETQFSTRLIHIGYRYQSEERVDAPRNYSGLAHVYYEANSVWSPTVSTQVWAEYLPNFSHVHQYYINGEGSLSAVLTRILSLKTAFSVRYENAPAPKATHYTDTLLTTSLVAKF